MERPATVRLPGWYFDPDDPARLRYWNGKSWTNRRRLRPSWTIATRDIALPEVGPEADGSEDSPVLDGPVRPAALPAVASSALTAPAPTNPLDRSSQPGGPGRRSATSLFLPGGPGSPQSGAGKGARDGVRRPLMALVAAVAVALLVMSVTVGVSHRYSAPVTVPVTRFVDAANTACAASMGTLPRAVSAPASGGRSKLGSTPTHSTHSLSTKALSTNGSPAHSSSVHSSAGGLLSASAAARSAKIVSALRNQLLSLPSAATAGAGVKRWLANWARFAQDRRAYAQLLTTNPPGSGPLPTSVAARRARLAADALSAAQAADQYALSHRLTECALSAHTSAAPVVSVP